MELSKLSLCGGVDENTPLFILIDIAESMSIDYTKIISKSRGKIIGVNNLIEGIRAGSGFLIKEPYTQDMYVDMAMLVNPNVDWIPDDLIKAYNHLIQFIDTSKYLDIPTDFECKYQDSQNITAIQPVVAYAACKYYGITTNLLTTQEELRLKLSSFIKDKNELRKKIIGLVESLADDHLLGLYHYIKDTSS